MTISFTASTPSGPPSLSLRIATVREHVKRNPPGDLLYYVSDSKDVRARRIRRESGFPDGEAFQVFAPSELHLPAWLPGTAPVALPNALILVLADSRGDVWLMHLKH